MYIMEYMIYHLKPFGIRVVEQCPDKEEKKLDAEPPLQEQSGQLVPAEKHEHEDTKPAVNTEKSDIDKNVIVFPKNTVHQKESTS